MWEDSLKLLHYGFDKFTKKTIISEGEVLSQVEITKQRINLKSAERFSYLRPQGKVGKLKKKIRYKDNLRLPVLKNEKIGELSLYNQNNKLIKTIDLLADQRIELPRGSQLWQNILIAIQTYF